MLSKEQFNKYKNLFEEKESNNCSKLVDNVLVSIKDLIKGDKEINENLILFRLRLLKDDLKSLLNKNKFNMDLFLKSANEFITVYETYKTVIDKNGNQCSSFYKNLKDILENEQEKILNETIRANRKK